MRTAALGVALLAAASAMGLTIEAERAPVATAGQKMPDGWNLHSNGRLGAPLRLARAGRYRVVVRARGSPCRGKWPTMVLLVDGRPRGRTTVASAEFRDYTFQTELPEGLCALTVAFTNDAVAGGEDRNLYLDRIVVQPPEGVPDPVPASSEEMAMAAQRGEDAEVARARRQIDQVRQRDVTLRVVDRAGKPVAETDVRVELGRHDFLFGCNIYMFDRFKTAQENEAYKRRFRELFNYATVGFYWRGYEWERGKPNYPYTDQVVAWCREHGIAMKGHPLLWDHRAGRPRWAGDKQPPPEVQRQRVAAILDRYADDIHYWEVVNEPAHLRGVPIEGPYRWAHEAAPDAYLILNDYHVMADGYPPFFELCKRAIAEGVPFQGIGIQAHEPRTMRFPLPRVREILDHYATLGKELHITEFTPTSGRQKVTGSHVEGVWDEAAQADYAVKFYTVCFAHPAVVGITWWDLCEQGAWLEGGGLLRPDLEPKKVYTALRRLIHEEWHTRVEGKTDGEGRLAFRGFRGTYAVEAAGKRATVHIGEAEPREVRVVVE
ncbi:MAG: endo-1,4-beta-xylanase [Candidatus Brocadiia bacterium]